MRVAALALLAGCAQILDLDDRSPSVTGTVVFDEIRNDESRSPMVVEAPDDTFDVTVVNDDGTSRPVHWPSDRRFWFPVTEWDQLYRLRVTTGSVVAEYQLHARDIRVGGASLGRIDRASPPVDTALAYMVSDAPLTGVTGVETTGLWTDTGRSTTQPTQTNTSFTIDWNRDVASVSGPRGLLDAAQYDRAYWIHHETIASPEGEMHWRISRYREDDVTLPAGAVTTVTGSSMPLDPSGCVRLDLRNQSEATRLQSAGVGIPVSGTWRVLAVPAAAENVTGLGLASPTVGSELRDVAFEVHFGNPFPGHVPVIFTRVTSRRNIVAPGAATSRPLESGTNRWTMPVEGDCATPATTATSVGIPGKVTLEGVGLATDRQLILIDETRPVELRWELVGDGPVDHYVVTLLEAVSSYGVTSVQSRATFVTVEQRLALAPARLVPGRLYMFSITARRGFPRSADGDLVELAYPVEEAFVATTSFFATRASPL